MSLLKLAKTKIADRAHWCKGALAKNADDNSCGYRNPDAIKFCALGALASVSDGSSQRLKECHLLSCAAQKLFGTYLTVVNNTRGHEAVMKVYDLAISMEEKDASQA